MSSAIYPDPRDSSPQSVATVSSNGSVTLGSVCGHGEQQRLSNARLTVARAEKAAARARTPKGYAGALADSVVGADGLILFVEALILTRQRPDLVPEIARTIERLHAEGARAYAGEIARHGWHTHHAPDVSARKFWTIALGVALEGHATGRSAAAMSEAMREALGKLAEARSAEDAAAPTLRLVTSSGRPSTKST